MRLTHVLDTKKVKQYLERCAMSRKINWLDNDNQ